MSIGKRSGQAVMIVIMGVMMVGGIILWLTKGEFHMMPGHGRGHGGGNAHVKEDVGAEARHAGGPDKDVATPADDRRKIDEENVPDTKSDHDPSSDGRKH